MISFTENFPILQEKLLINLDTTDAAEKAVKMIEFLPD